jgi:hypothetical protein
LSASSSCSHSLGFGAAGWNHFWGPGSTISGGDQGDDFFNAFGLPEHDSDQQVADFADSGQRRHRDSESSRRRQHHGGRWVQRRGAGPRSGLCQLGSDAKKIFDAEAAHVTVSGSAVLVKSDSNSAAAQPHRHRSQIRKVTVNAGKGDVTAAGLGAGIGVTAAHGDVHLSAITGSVQVHFSNGKHDFSAHQVTATSPPTATERLSPSPRSRARSRRSGEILGDVHMENVSGPVHLHTSVTDLQVAELPGDLTLNSDDLRVTEAKGQVRVVTHSKDVDLSQIYGDTYVEDRDGRISVEPAGNYSVDAKNSKGDVEVTLPPNASATVDGRTRNGDMFPTLRFPSAATRTRRSPGKIGSGGSKIVLSTDNGDLRIKKGGSIGNAPREQHRKHIRISSFCSVHRLPRSASVRSTSGLVIDAGSSRTQPGTGRNNAARNAHPCQNLQSPRRQKHNRSQQSQGHQTRMRNRQPSIPGSSSAFSLSRCSTASHLTPGPFPVASVINKATAGHLQTVSLTTRPHVITELRTVHLKSVHPLPRFRCILQSREDDCFHGPCAHPRHHRGARVRLARRGVCARSGCAALVGGLLDSELPCAAARAAGMCLPELAAKYDERLDPWYYRYGKIFWHDSGLSPCPGYPTTRSFDSDRMLKLIRQEILERSRGRETASWWAVGAACALAGHAGLLSRVCVRHRERPNATGFTRAFPKQAAAGRPAPRRLRQAARRRHPQVLSAGVVLAQPVPHASELLHGHRSHDRRSPERRRASRRSAPKKPPPAHRPSTSHEAPCPVLATFCCREGGKQ